MHMKSSNSPQNTLEFCAQSGIWIYKRMYKRILYMYMYMYLHKMALKFAILPTLMYHKINNNTPQETSNVFFCYFCFLFCLLCLLMCQKEKPADRLHTPVIPNLPVPRERERDPVSRALRIQNVTRRINCVEPKLMQGRRLMWFLLAHQALRKYTLLQFKCDQSN